MKDITLNGVEIHVGDYKLTTDNMESNKILTVLINVVTNMISEMDKDEEAISLRLKDTENNHRVAVGLEKITVGCRRCIYVNGRIYTRKMHNVN